MDFWCFATRIASWNEASISVSLAPMAREKDTVEPVQFCQTLAFFGSLRQCFSQAEVDYFHSYSACLLQTDHDIAWFDVPVNEVLLMHGSQSSGDLRNDFQRQFTSSRPERLIRASGVSPSTNSVA
jgi:hypothetical protein